MTFDCLIVCENVTCVVNAISAAVKDTGELSSMPLPESQHIAGSVASPSVNDDNTEINAGEIQPVSKKRKILTTPVSEGTSQTEETLHLSGTQEFIVEHSVASPVTENVSANMLQSSVTPDADSVLPTGNSVGEAGDAKITQLAALKPDIAVTGQGAAVSITSNDALANAADASDLHMQPVAASVDQETDLQVDHRHHQQEQGTVISKENETGEGDSPRRTVRGVADDVPSTRVSVYETDVAIYKQKARSADAGDPESSMHEATMPLLSATYVSIPRSPANSDSVFYSPQSHVSDNVNTNDSVSPSVDQRKQHDFGATVSAASEAKTVIYRRSDTALAHERRTINECTQSMLNVEMKTDDHRENGEKVEREEPLEVIENEDRDSKDDAEDEDDDDDDDDDRDNDNEDKARQDESAAATEPQNNKNELSMSTKAKKKRKAKKKKKKKCKQQYETSAVAAASTVKSADDDVESSGIKRPPQMQSTVMSSDREHETKAAQSAITSSVNRTLNTYTDASTSGTSDAVNHLDGKTTDRAIGNVATSSVNKTSATYADTVSPQQQHEPTSSTPNTYDVEVCKSCIFHRTCYFCLFCSMYCVHRSRRWKYFWNSVFFNTVCRMMYD